MKTPKKKKPVEAKPSNRGGARENAGRFPRLSPEATARESQVSVGLTPELREGLDQKRGAVPRATYLRALLEADLKASLPKA